MASLDTLVAEAGDLLPEAVDLRRRIHRRPELGLQLPETQAAVLEAIDGLGLDEVRTGTSTSSVIAVLDSGRPGPTVLLRGDMDALPLQEDTGLEYASEIAGSMHACGHDAHTAMLASAAKVLSARRRELTGRVLFMFQPGEEGHGGAKVMLDEGLLEGHEVARAFAIHQSPTIPSGVVATRPGALLASADGFVIDVRGRGGHASMPHHACDPVPVACEMVGAMQTMVTRRVDAFDPAVVTVACIRAGTTGNVIPETAELCGTIRTVSEKTRTLVHEELARVAAGIAAAHGAAAEFRLEAGYPVTVNDDASAEWVVELGERLLGDARVVVMPSPAMGAEDWSYVLQEVPGAMAFLGTRPPGVPAHEVAPNHSNRMVIDEGAMAAGIALYAAVALEQLAPPAG